VKDFDERWQALLTQSPHFIFNDQIEEENLEHAVQSGCQIYGCRQHRTCRPEYQWRARMYIGGRRRTIAIGTVYQCAFVYDLARVYFKKYRTHKSDLVPFNLAPNNRELGEQQARDFIASDPQARKYLESMEKILLDHKLIAEKKVSAPRVKHESFSIRLAQLTSRIAQLEVRLAKLETSNFLNTIPIKSYSEDPTKFT
jgi:hypothetical protein